MPTQREFGNAIADVIHISPLRAGTACTGAVPWYIDVGNVEHPFTTTVVNLHFEIRYRGEAVNPYNYLPKK